MKNVMFFSFTGSEIADIIELCNLKDVTLVTNKPVVEHDQINKRLNNYPLFYLPKNPTVQDYYDIFKLIDINADTLITLHGYMRIIPREICETVQIFNGHPAYLIDYPELKGKDQQNIVFEQQRKYKTIGSVIHSVVPVVDAGEILYGCYTKNDCKTMEDTINVLKLCSLKTWVHFFKDLQYNLKPDLYPSITQLSK